MAAETIADAMERTGGRPRGFDYLRIALSVGVLLWHSARVSYPEYRMSPLEKGTVGMVLPMFFALSGFLISGSLNRVRSIGEFATLRAIRIVPALAVETLISLVLIGSLFTTLPLHDFYAHPRTHRYLLNIIGWVHLGLPGVFMDLPNHRVNASLWTVPFELECYLVIMVLWATGIVKRAPLLLAAAIAVQLLVFGNDLRHHDLMPIDFRISGRVLISCFLFGVVMYQYRDRVILKGWLCVAAALLGYLLLQTSVGAYFVALPAAYVTVWLGLLNPRRIPVVLDGDYSYGIYLYAYPIQQAITSLMPVPYRQWYINAPLALIVVSVFAAFSWHYVEKPILHRRKHMVGVVERALARLSGRRELGDPTDVSAMDIKSQP